MSKRKFFVFWHDHRGLKPHKKPSYSKKWHIYLERRASTCFTAQIRKNGFFHLHDLPQTEDKINTISASLQGPKVEDLKQAYSEYYKQNAAIQKIAANEKPFTATRY